eukprot:403336278
MCDGNTASNQFSYHDNSGKAQATQASTSKIVEEEEKQTNLNDDSSQFQQKSTKSMQNQESNKLETDQYHSKKQDDFFEEDLVLSEISNLLLLCMIKDCLATCYEIKEKDQQVVQEMQQQLKKPLLQLVFTEIQKLSCYNLKSYIFEGVLQNLLDDFQSIFVTSVQLNKELQIWKQKLEEVRDGFKLGKERIKNYAKLTLRETLGIENDPTHQLDTGNLIKKASTYYNYLFFIKKQ